MARTKRNTVGWLTPTGSASEAIDMRMILSGSCSTKSATRRSEGDSSDLRAASTSRKRTSPPSRASIAVIGVLRSIDCEETFHLDTGPQRQGCHADRGSAMPAHFPHHPAAHLETPVPSGARLGDVGPGSDATAHPDAGAQPIERTQSHPSPG